MASVTTVLGLIAGSVAVAHIATTNTNLSAPHNPVYAAAAAKAFATEAAVAACERSIQIHGGTGFTWEHPLHRFYKRAIWLEGYGTRPSALHLEIANSLLS